MEPQGNLVNEAFENYYYILHDKNYYSIFAWHGNDETTKNFYNEDPTEEQIKVKVPA